jgi:hypothetical protein
MEPLRYYLIVGIFAILSSCSNGDSVSDEERASIPKEIQERLDGYADAVKRKDLEWVQKFWSNEKDFVLAGDGELSTDYNTVVIKDYGDFFNTMREMSYLNWSNGHALVLNENTVSYATKFEWQAVMESGDTIKSTGSWLYLFKKADGQWKAVHSAGTHIYK